MRGRQPGGGTLNTCANLAGLLIQPATHNASAARGIPQDRLREPGAGIISALPDSRSAACAREVINAVCKLLPASLATTQSPANRSLRAAHDCARPKPANEPSSKLSAL